MNFIEVVEYLRESPTNFVTHEEWLTKENKVISYIGCFDKINIDQIYDIGDIPIERFSHIELMLSNRWIKLQDWHKSKKEHTKLHTFEEALNAYKSGKSIRRKGYGMIHNDDSCDLDRDDLMANDWEILP